MTFRESLRKAGRAVKANLRPGILLWTVLLLFCLAYAFSEPFKDGLMRVAEYKREIGYPFSFIAYMISAAILPEILQVIFFQHWKIGRKNWGNIAFGIPVWGMMGVTIDFFYRCQAVWFGNGTDPATLAVKTVVDQFLFTPLNCGAVLALFLWRKEKFGKSVLPKIFSGDFLAERLLPMLAAAWCVWIPGVLVVYCMPPALQLPVGALIYSFWILIFTFLHKEN